VNRIYYNNIKGTEKTNKYEVKNIMAIEDHTIVWLNSIIHESTPEYRKCIGQLRAIVNSIKVFIQFDDCINYMNDIKKEKVYLILSDDSAEQLISPLQDNGWSQSFWTKCPRKKSYPKPFINNFFLHRLVAHLILFLDILLFLKQKVLL